MTNSKSAKFSTFDLVCAQTTRGCIGLELQVPKGQRGIASSLTFKLAMPLAMSVKEALGLGLGLGSFAERALMQLIMDDSFPKKVLETTVFSKFIEQQLKPAWKLKNYQIGVSAALTERRATLSKCELIVEGDTIIVTGDVNVHIPEAQTDHQLAVLENRSTDIKFISSDVSFVNGVPFYTDFVQYRPSNFEAWTEYIDVWIAGTPQYGNPICLAKLHRSTHTTGHGEKGPWKLTIDTTGLEITETHKKVYAPYLQLNETLQHTAWRCIEKQLGKHFDAEEEVTMSAMQIYNFIRRYYTKMY
mgnify:CR=1 FL=1